MKRLSVWLVLALSSLLVFTSCDPSYPTWYVYECFFVENKSNSPVIIEFYRLTGWDYISDTAKWNDYYPYLCPLEDSDIQDDGSESVSFVVQSCKAIVNPGSLRMEIFHLLWWVDADYLEEKNACFGRVTLYNLRDTTSFSFTEYEEGMPFVEHVWREDSIQPDPQINIRADYRTEFSISIDELSLSAMQKDYTMLEKFPQYFSKRRE